MPALPTNQQLFNDGYTVHYSFSYGASTYYYVSYKNIYGQNQNINFNHANTTAAKYGGYLAAITTPQENSFIASILYNTVICIGLNDVQTENNFVWTSGEAVSYTSWQYNQPVSNYYGEDYYSNFDYTFFL